MYDDDYGDYEDYDGYLGPDSDARMWGMLLHLSTLLAFVGIPFGGILSPLVIWFIKGNDDPFISHHAKEAINYQITTAIYMLIAVVLVLVAIGFLLIPIVVIIEVVFTVAAAIKARGGEYYVYPGTIRFLR